ncbi:MAG: hypothetical protein R3E40_11155 [Rhodocyclaceae bacterium]
MREMKSVKSTLARIRFAPRNWLRSLLGKTRLSDEALDDPRDFAAWLASTHGMNAPDPQAPLFLVLSFLPLAYCLKIERIIAAAMRRAGYRVVFLTNDACREIVMEYHHGHGPAPVLILEDFLKFLQSRQKRTQLKRLFADNDVSLGGIKAFRYLGCYVGLHALATQSASTKDGRLQLDGAVRRRLKKIMLHSMILADTAQSIIRQLKPSIVMGVEKGFVGTAEIFYAALENGVDYVQWTGCHEPNAIMLKRYRWSNYREHPFSISASSWERILSLPWDDRYRGGVMAQFETGYKEGAWFKYKSLATDQQQREKHDLMAQLGLNPEKKTAVIYSHILNDANLFYGDDLFSGGYEEWLIETVRAAATSPEVNWVLKLHPANVYRNARLGYSGKYGELLALEHAFGQVPEFLRVVYPEEKTSPLSFFKITDYGITVRGTVGLELPCFGIPTLTAGTGRYAGKGFTVDSHTREEYIEKIRSIHRIPALTAAQIQLGQRYAYFVFRARPARYGDMFSDVYNFPVNHPRHRDVALGGQSLNAVLEHPQMQKIVSFLRSGEEDFIDLNAT